MDEFWQRVIDRKQSFYSVDQLQAAAYRLITDQVLYRSDRSARIHYDIVATHEDEMASVVALLGINLVVRRQAKYAVAIPKHAKSSAATIKQAALALVLLKVYHLAFQEGRITPDSEVECHLEELRQVYLMSTGQELPSKAELEQLFRTMKRWGIARTEDNEGPLASFETSSKQPYQVYIRPAIADVLGEAALERLAQFAPSDEGDVVDVEPDTDAEEEIV